MQLCCCHTHTHPQALLDCADIFKCCGVTDKWKEATEIERIASKHIMYLFLMLDRFFKITYIWVIYIVIQFSRNSTVTSRYILAIPINFEKRKKIEIHPPHSLKSIAYPIKWFEVLAYRIKFERISWHLIWIGWILCSLLFAWVLLTNIITGASIV